MRDLLQALSGLPLDPLPIPLSQEYLFAPVAAAAERAKIVPPAATLRPTSFELDGAAPPQLSVFCLTPLETQTLIRAAREEGTTVHAAIVAAAYLADHDALVSWRRDPVRIFSPVSMGPILGLNDECAVAVTCALTVLNGFSGGDLWHLARTSKQQLLPQQLAAGIANSLGFIEMSTANNASSTEVSDIAAAMIGCEFIVTNIGKVPFESHFGSLTIQALWGPIIHQGYTAEQTIGVTTVNGCLCLTYTSVAPVPRALESIVAILMQASGVAIAA